MTVSALTTGSGLLTTQWLARRLNGVYLATSQTSRAPRIKLSTTMVQTVMNMPLCFPSSILKPFTTAKMTHPTPTARQRSIAIKTRSDGSIFYSFASTQTSLAPTQ